MTDDQCERLNRFLAERVMGWEFIENQPYSWYQRQWGPPIYVSHWKPATSWADCEPLLDTIERDGWTWIFDNGTDGGYGSHVWRLPHSGHGWSKSSRTEALCVAIGRAYGWKVEV